MSSNIRLEKNCQYCGDRFIAKTTVTQCCSDECAKKAYKKRKRQEKIQTAMEKVKDDHNKILLQKEYLTIHEACELINASRWTIYRLIDNGQLHAGKIGRNIRIPKAAIYELFKPTQL